MLYGVICFAMLFSFTGTVLGGIWADQSWGTFLGLGRQGKRRLADRDLERADPSRPLGRSGQGARHGGSGRVRQHHHCLVVVRRQHARRRPAFLWIHARQALAVLLIRSPVLSGGCHRRLLCSCTASVAARSTAQDRIKLGRRMNVEYQSAGAAILDRGPVSFLCPMNVFAIPSEADYLSPSHGLFDRQPRKDPLSWQRLEKSAWPLSASASAPSSSPSTRHIQTPNCTPSAGRP